MQSLYTKADDDIVRRETDGTDIERVIDPVSFEELKEWDRQDRSTIFVEAEGLLHRFETDTIKGIIETAEKKGRNPTHPLTRREFKPEEINYFKFYIECNSLYNGIRVTSEEKSKLMNWFGNYIDGCYHNLPEEDISKSLIKIRNFITIDDFQSHFKEFDPTDSRSISYERELAEVSLSAKGIGSWLLRHSSKARIGDKNEIQKMSNLGITYYALSYKRIDKTIDHLLICHQFGHGWKEHEYTSTRGISWQPCFIDLIGTMLRMIGVKFNNKIGNYY
jgi:hypothetical protein